MNDLKEKKPSQNGNEKEILEFEPSFIDHLLIYRETCALKKRYVRANQATFIAAKIN